MRADHGPKEGHAHAKTHALILPQACAPECVLGTSPSLRVISRAAQTSARNGFFRQGSDTYRVWHGEMMQLPHSPSVVTLRRYLDDTCSRPYRTVTFYWHGASQVFRALLLRVFSIALACLAGIENTGANTMCIHSEGAGSCLSLDGRCAQARMAAIIRACVRIQSKANDRSKWSRRS
eukprot:6189604-Pleurochrysis_carterae.AAC.3